MGVTVLGIQHNFYPRSPCGERHNGHETSLDRAWVISIHALLAESDGLSCNGRRYYFDFYPRSPCGERLYTDLDSSYGALISIHALLAESDWVLMGDLSYD